ncbi:MutS family DNA mismatch repair protein [Ktedonobacter racemifer]|uniref:DNA mismatch repair protein MutS domain protein n=1 Tax=Ktedonobacter racemifer DSM 44963 TaxID=485913 RepID=D6TDP5_KTERA|nr:MutS family DNA mismatch repair protein [Ktedonobacter racemifer]EFH90177.1 DNA mismatch repair protein MutS domain protein [Ktedonobacter racemifer DSM 44963]
MEKKEERVHLLERQLQRVQRHIEQLDARSNRYSWIRLFIFFGGLAVSLVVGFLLWWLGIILGVLSLLAFGVAAYYHSQVDRSLARHKAWLLIKSTHLARARLDWEHIPAPAPASGQEDHPFEFDLDVTGKYSLHRLLDMSFSREGSERLRSWLLATEPDLECIRTRQALVEELRPLSRFRDKLVLFSLIATKGKTGQVQGQELVDWLKRNPPSKGVRPLLWASLVLNAFTLIDLVASVVTSTPALWVLTFFGGIFFLALTQKIRGNIFEDAGYMSDNFGALGSVFGFLENYSYGHNQHLARLCAAFQQQGENRPSRVLRGIGRISSAAGLKANGLLWLLVNLFLPWDAYCAYRLGQYKEQIVKFLPGWLDTWFDLEALNALATFAYLNPEYILPEVLANDQLTQEKATLFSAHSLGHPLIQDRVRVTNDFAFHRLGEVDILTGSNMAGKSTFLRTLGVNLCLAYAGGPVCASALTTRLFRLFTCIRVNDSVTDGYSYFYAEVRRLRQLLDALEQSSPYPLFFLIDEIFKGTNNRERLSGSRAFVRAIVGHDCLGAISTHDLELVHLEEAVHDLKNYHFREEVVEGQMVFDYKLRTGPCPTTNALKIMQMEGLPVEEVDVR